MVMMLDRLLMLEVPTVDFPLSVCIDEEEKMKSWVGEIKRETGEGLMKLWRKNNSESIQNAEKLRLLKVGRSILLS